MSNFWPACGFDKLHRDANGYLVPTPDYFRLFLNRPELALVNESCAAEIKLHSALQAYPLLTTDKHRIAKIRDADARHNYAVYFKFRDSLLAKGTLEHYYTGLFRQTTIDIPPDFIDLMVQAMVRNLLDSVQDARQARAAEMLFRSQRISVQDGQVLAADLKVVDMHSENGGLGELGRLLIESKAPLRSVNLQVLNDDNAAEYFQSGEKYNFLLDLTHEMAQELSHGLTLRMTRARSGLKALAQVLTLWIRHMLGVEVQIEPLQNVQDPQWRWHIGLDVESTALLNDLYEDRPVEPERMQRLISLFKLDFTNPGDMRADVAGKPVYLGLMMSPDKVVRLKPQNLLLNLPLKSLS